MKRQPRAKHRKRKPRTPAVPTPTLHLELRGDTLVARSEHGPVHLVWGPAPHHCHCTLSNDPDTTPPAALHIPLPYLTQRSHTTPDTAAGDTWYRVTCARAQLETRTLEILAVDAEHACAPALATSEAITPYRPEPARIAPWIATIARRDDADTTALDIPPELRDPLSTRPRHGTR